MRANRNSNLAGILMFLPRCAVFRIYSTPVVVSTGVKAPQTMPKLVRPKKPAQTKSTSPSKKNKQAKSDLEGLQRKPKREKKPRWDVSKAN